MIRSIVCLLSSVIDGSLLFFVLNRHIPRHYCVRNDAGTYAKTDPTSRKTIGRFAAHNKGSIEEASDEGSNEKANAKADDGEAIVKADDGET